MTRVLALLLSLAAAGCRASAPALVGAWRAQVQFHAGVLAAVKDLEFLSVFHADGRSYESTLLLELFDASGKPVAGGGEASVHARRAGF